MSHDIIFDPPEDIIRMPSPYAPKAVPPAPTTPATSSSDPPPPARRTGGRPKGSVTSKPPPEVAASSQARRIAAVLLEVLAGLRATGSAAKELGITPMRFYQIEERAIGGLISACEPRPSGLQPERRDALELASLREQVRRQTQELNQARSVLRTTRRQLGVATAPEPIAVKPGTRKDGKPTKAKVRRPTVRALTMVRRLMKADATAAAASGSAASTGLAPGATSTPEPGGG
jgi:hypothetical protein